MPPRSGEDSCDRPPELKAIRPTPCWTSSWLPFRGLFVCSQSLPRLVAQEIAMAKGSGKKTIGRGAKKLGLVGDFKNPPASKSAAMGKKAC